eukprot:5023227-Prymnesium_polylepis.2
MLTWAVQTARCRTPGYGCTAVREEEGLGVLADVDRRRSLLRISGSFFSHSYLEHGTTWHWASDSETQLLRVGSGSPRRTRLSAPCP